MKKIRKVFAITAEIEKEFSDEEWKKFLEECRQEKEDILKTCQSEDELKIVDCKYETLVLEGENWSLL